MADTKALRDELQAEKARRSLIDYAERVVPWFQRAEHLETLAQIFSMVEAGKVRRAIVTCPPGAGKSTLTQCAVGWFLGKKERRKVLMVSASEPLARRNSRAVRDQCQSERYPFAASARGDSFSTEALSEWELSSGSGVRCVGVNGNLTGFRADLLVCDDVQADEGTPTSREWLEKDWLRPLALTRLDPGGRVILIATRFGTDDLVARLMDPRSPGSADWHHWNIPAIAEDGDLLGRAPGEPLWPERFPLEEWNRIRVEVGSRAWSGLYQGRPVPLEGNIVKAAWLRQRYDVLPADAAVRGRGAIGLDAAAKTGVQNDRSAMVHVIADPHGHFWVDGAWADRVAYTDLRQKVIERNRAWSPEAVLIEDASSGTPVAQELAETAVPVIPVTPKGTKAVRLEAVSPLLEAGKVHFRAGDALVEELLEELLSVPTGKHDDLADAFVHALTWLRGRGTVNVMRGQAGARYNPWR